MFTLPGLWELLLIVISLTIMAVIVYLVIKVVRDISTIATKARRDMEKDDTTNNQLS